MALDDFDTEDDSGKQDVDVSIDEDINDLLSQPRLNRRRGPYMTQRTYDKLKAASEVYDMSVQDVLDVILELTLDEEGSVKDKHSVLKNELSNL